MNVQHVPVEFVNQVWPNIEGYLKAAVEQQEGEQDYTLDQVRTLVTMGQWLLVIAVDEKAVCRGAATINFSNRPNHRVAFITYIGGKLISNPGTFEQLSAIVKNFGATCIEGAVNDAVGRLWRRFGFKDKYRIVGVTL
jgi:hypothetical protein